MRDVGEVINDVGITKGFKINPETGRLISDGHEYANTQRMRGYITRANTIREILPPPNKDQVRLWRGNRPGEEGENPSFTSSLEGIALPFLDSYGGGLTYVDVPKSDIGKYVSSGAHNAEFMLPPELVKNSKIAANGLALDTKTRDAPSLKNEGPGTQRGNPTGWDSA